MKRRGRVDEIETLDVHRVGADSKLQLSFGARGKRQGVGQGRIIDTLAAHRQPTEQPIQIVPCEFARPMLRDEQDAAFFVEIRSRDGLNEAQCVSDELVRGHVQHPRRSVQIDVTSLRAVLEIPAPVLVGGVIPIDALHDERMADRFTLNQPSPASAEAQPPEQCRHVGPAFQRTLNVVVTQRESDTNSYQVCM